MSFSQLNKKLIKNILKFYYKYIKDFITQAKAELVLDRIKNKGKNCRIKGDLTILGVDGLVLGDFVSIGYGGFINSFGGVEIGDNCQISRNVLIYSVNHDTNGMCIPYDSNNIKKKVIIGNSVWIGMNVVITPGVKIGDGAIIGMGTVVSTDVPEGAIVVGAKQRIVGSRDLKVFIKMKDNKDYFGIKYPKG